MFDNIKKDITAVRDRDPAARSNMEVLLLYSGFHALMLHRASHKLYKNQHFFSARLISQLGRFMTGIEIHPGAKIGNGVFIDHGMGVVIGETAEIGNNCTIYQGVTLGGTGKDQGKRHPTLKDNVMVGCGAKVLGPFTVGKGSKIAANAVVLKAVPDYKTVVGVPGNVIERKRPHNDCENFDQVHIPDPVAQKICKMIKKIETLENRIDNIENNNQKGDNN